MTTLAYFLGLFIGTCAGYLLRAVVQDIRDRGRYRKLVASRLQDRERGPREY